MVHSTKRWSFMGATVSVLFAAFSLRHSLSACVAFGDTSPSLEDFRSKVSALGGDVYSSCARTATFAPRESLSGALKICEKQSLPIGQALSSLGSVVIQGLDALSEARSDRSNKIDGRIVPADWTLIGTRLRLSPSESLQGESLIKLLENNTEVETLKMNLQGVVSVFQTQIDKVYLTDRLDKELEVTQDYYFERISEIRKVLETTPPDKLDAPARCTPPQTRCGTVRLSLESAIWDLSERSRQETSRILELRYQSAILGNSAVQLISQFR